MSKNYLKIQYSILILNCSVIPLLITGPFLSDLAVSLSGVLFLIYCALEKKWDYFNNSFFKLFFIFYLYYLVRSIEADDINRVLTKHFFYIRHGIFVISTMWLIKNFSNYKSNFLYIAILTFFILCADALFQFFYGTNILGFNSGNSGNSNTLKFNATSYFNEEEYQMKKLSIMMHHSQDPPLVFYQDNKPFYDRLQNECKLNPGHYEEHFCVITKEEFLKT